MGPGYSSRDVPAHTPFTSTPTPLAPQPRRAATPMAPVQKGNCSSATPVSKGSHSGGTQACQGSRYGGTPQNFTHCGGINQQPLVMCLYHFQDRCRYV